ncbi:MAG: hypothetical protein QM802_05235 [Agriterribacter sp.]
MKSIVPALALSVTVSIAVAQQPVVISIGAGINNAPSSLKEKNYLGNGYDVNGNIFIPFISKADSRFALGILAGGTFYTSGNLAPDAGKLQSQYQLYNGSLAISQIQNQGSTSKAIMGAIGLQANFKLNCLAFSPSVSGGYFSLKQGGFAEHSDVMVNGTTQTITLLSLDEAKKKGFIIIPQLKISYALTEKFGIYTSASFNAGAKINTEQNVLEPKGGFNEKNTYEPSQLSSGKMISQPVTTTYQTWMLNIGGSLSLARKAKKTSTMPSRLSMTPTTTRQTQGSTFGEKVNQGLQPAAAKSNNPLYNNNGTATTNPLYEQSKMASPGSPIGGITVKGGKNPGGNLMVVQSDNNGVFELQGLESGTYSFNLTIPDEPQGKSINEKGVKRQETAELEKRTYTGGRKNEPQGSEAAQARPGNPIGGIIVKGGKNPGGSMTNLSINNEGLIQFEVLEPGNYRFIIQTTEEDNKNNAKKKKVEKATSGLKDTLKTNV